MNSRPLPLRLMMTDEPLPAGTAICLACGWQRAELPDTYAEARGHNQETRHPTMAALMAQGGDRAT